MAEDKVIRWRVDGSETKKSVDDIQKKFTDFANQNQKFSKEEINDLKQKLKLLEQLQKQQEEALRSRIRSRQLDVQYAEKDLESWRIERSQQAETLSGDKRSKFVRETSRETTQRRAELLEERKGIIGDQSKLEDLRDTNKKQVSELRNITDTIKGESVKDRRTTEGFMSRVTGVAPSMMSSGSLAGGASSMLGLLGTGAALGAIVGTALSMTKSYQQQLNEYSVATQTPIAISNMIAAGFRVPKMALSSEEGLKKHAMYSGAFGSVLDYDERSPLFGLIGAQKSRGITDQQIMQLLTVQRYSGVSALGTVSSMENFARQRDGHIYRLPELLELYLKTANQILNKTGKVDANALQQTLTSISKSYNVSGVGLQHITSGVSTLTGKSSSSIMTAMQMETLRNLYPNMSTYEMMGIMENPMQNPEYVKAHMNRLTKFGGGGETTKWMLKAQSGLMNPELDKIASGKFNISDFTKVSSDQSLSDFYQNEAPKFLGTIEKLETSIGVMKDSFVKGMSSFLEVFDGLYKDGSQYDKTTTKAISKGVEQGLNNSKYP